MSIHPLAFLTEAAPVLLPRSDLCVPVADSNGLPAACLGSRAEKSFLIQIHFRSVTFPGDKTEKHMSRNLKSAPPIKLLATSAISRHLTPSTCHVATDTRSQEPL